MENIPVAKSLAAKRRQKVDSNQELIALGAANLARFRWVERLFGGLDKVYKA